MASKKLSSDTSLANSYKLSRGVASVARPSAPTIGTATDGGSGLMSVTFTASTLGPTASSFALTSSSGVTGSGASSPLTLQEAAVGTYTYSVSGVNANGTGPSSAASNSVVVASLFTQSAFDSIATTTLSTATASVTFSSIPATYTHLQVRALTSNASYATSSAALYLNSDTTAGNYRNHFLYGSGSSAAASTDGNSAGNGVMGSGMSTGPAAWVIDLLDYKDTNKYKTIRLLNGYDTNGGGYVWLGSNLWMNTAAVSTFTITAGAGTFAQYSSFALYGIKAA